MTSPENNRPPEELVIQHFGAAVMLCWTELPPAMQKTILDQAEDMIGLTPVPEIRSRISGMILRHSKV